MDSNRKRFSFGWYTGALLGVTFSGAVVYAVTLPHTFTDGTTISASQVNANFAALSTAIDGCPTEMVRVGASCIDTAANYVTAATSGCGVSGAGCTGSALTVGTAPASPTPFAYSWGQAVAACTNAGKRLASGAEIIAASNAGSITVPNGSFLYVDASAARSAGSDLAYAGTHVFLTSSTFGLGGTNTPYTEVFPKDSTEPTVGFRCAK